MKSLYELLGIEPGATQAQIEQGYRQRLDHYIASQSKGKQDEETRRIQMAREAYLLLCSPKRRQAYDQQLRLYQKARAQMARRGNRRFLMWLTLAIFVMLAGIYGHRIWQHNADVHAQQMLEQQAARTAFTLADQQSVRRPSQELGAGR
jgi:curved DNA-binding protein CbpA